MITKINNIKNFGIFKNFNGNNLPAFSKFNLIYGWNYSGKTTLSRVFRCLEIGKLHNDYNEATFELKSEIDIYNNTFSAKPAIKVFNSDFIKDNLSWESESIEPIFLLGEQNIELQKELIEQETILQNLETELNNTRKLNQEKQSQLNISLTNKAREMTELLNLGRGFDRDRLKQKIEVIKDEIPNNLLERIDVEKYKIQAMSSEQKSQIDPINIIFLNLSALKAETEIILNKQAASEVKIKHLLDNNRLSEWVEVGKELHKEKAVCGFCGNQLPIDLFERLNKHFSKDYDDLKHNINNKIKTLNNAQVMVNQLPVETAFYTDMRLDFTKYKTALEEAIKLYNDALTSLIDDLGLKKEHPFDRLEVTNFTNNQSEVENALSNFNLVISENNKRTIDFTAEKEAAIEKLKNHFAADFETTENYSTIQLQILEEEKAYKLKSNDIETQKNKISNIKAQLDETVKGAEQVNEYLKIFFGNDDIKVDVTNDKKFRLIRGNSIAKNLSEGEKTAISFAYFTTKLEEQNNKLSDTIVFIDDPISSLDSNHLFNIYSFIKGTFYELTPHDKVHNLKCKQIFISSHNFEFYNLIYDWFSKTKKTDRSFYLIERTKNGHINESQLKESNNFIEKYKSEYVYLFSIIYKFYLSPIDTFEHLYHLPNILRRFVEIYLNFKFLATKNIDEDIYKLITNSIDCERSRKFMHYYSHSLSTDRFMQLPNLSECRDIVKIIVEAIQKHDLIHFESLKSTTDNLSSN